MHLDLLEAFRPCGTQLGVAVAAAAPNSSQGIQDVFVAHAIPYILPAILAFNGEQACEETPIG
jgi:hypothetical protein